MTHPQPPSKLVQWCLRALVPKADADALLGDLSEEQHARPGSSGVSPGATGDIEWRAWRYVLALLPSAARHVGSSIRHIVGDAVRSLRSAPGTTAGIILILTLGISAATVTFSVVDTVVLRPLPFDHDEELVVVEMSTIGESEFSVRSLGPYHYRMLSERLTSMASIGVVARMSGLTLNTGGEPEPLETAQVSASLFDTLRTRPFIGQTFTIDNEVDGNQRVGVISYDLWQRRFGGDPAIVGRTMTVTRRLTMGGATSNESLTVVGIMPRGFAYPMSMVPPPDVWTPYVMTAEERSGAARGQYLHALGRLRPGVSLDAAQAEARSIAVSWDALDQETALTRQFRVVPLKATLVDDVRGWMLLVLGAVAVVMLIACVNVANLQLVRAAGRARELSIRASLGATRRQLVTSLLVETLLLSLIAAALAILASTWGIQAAKDGLPQNLARVAEIGLDVRVLTATIAAAVVTGLLFGVVPAWQASREDLVSLLKQGTMTLGIGRRRWRAAFVIAEVAFVSVLLVGATLVITSFIRVTTADIGFDRSHLLFVSGNTGVDAAETRAAIVRLQGLPGVAAVGAIALGSPPLALAGFRSGGATVMTVNPVGHPPGAEALAAETRSVSSGYFAAAGIAVVRGRSFDDGEVARDTTMVIDERAAAELFGQGNAVGVEVVVSGTSRRTVVAVVRHVSLRGPEETSRPQVYVPARTDRGGFNFLVRTSVPPEAVVPSIRAALPGAATSGASALQIRPLEDAFRNITADRRFNATVMSIFGVLAVVIGAAGIFGVLASVVAQQTREMSLRVALGATTSRIFVGVLVQAGRYLVTGLAIGLTAAWWASQSIATILFDVRPGNPAAYVAVAVVIVAAGLVAAVVPARRAARVDPRLVLRSE